MDDIIFFVINVEINDKFREAIRLVDSGKNIFITGKAGTGKSTLLKVIKESLTQNYVVLAPTGVAAVNIGGQTIHSFFGFRPDITVEKVLKRKYPRNPDVYENLEVLIIDEISMVRADLLDCVNTFLTMHGPEKGRPFGGVQLVFIGDLYQLPPIVTYKEKDIFNELYFSPYFFDSKAFSEVEFKIIELTKIYRQTEEEFVSILNSVRNKTVTDELLDSLNKRVDFTFDPDPKEGYIELVTVNAKADIINDRRLKTLSGKIYSFEGIISGEFDERSYPAPHILDLKIGAQVMLTSNDSKGRWFNGTVGIIEKIDDEVSVRLENGNLIEVTSNTWEMYKFSFDRLSQKIVSEVAGAFTQYPLMLSWAVTIHKSQGKTFNKVIVDMGAGAFAHGQTYVALSRCATLSGLVLRVPIEKRHILLDNRVVNFFKNYNFGVE
ncbi:AAA family ATPase [Candidatus Dojkabacteria bacterium]|nr:AAA family ATPase [Candidatus Dojkabacteria bacterium]